MLSSPNDESPANIEAAVSAAGFLFNGRTWRLFLSHYYASNWTNLTPSFLSNFIERVARELPLIQEEGPAYSQTLSRRFLSCHHLILFFLGFSFESTGHKQELEKMADNSNDLTGALMDDGGFVPKIRELDYDGAFLFRLVNYFGEHNWWSRPCWGRLSIANRSALPWTLRHDTTHIPNKNILYQHHSLLSKVVMMFNYPRNCRVVE